MSQRQLPFMSVVICVYNGAGTLGRAIESLLAQDYPRDRYEIIVVDDGSTDTSAEIAARYPVHIVRHDGNRGASAARSTGLAHVRGDIYVCFDCDCEVAPNWLRTLASGYRTAPTALGLGSVIAPPTHVHDLVDRFMVAAGSGNPPSLKLGAHPHPLRRLWAYLVDQLQPERPTTTHPYPVRHLNSASSSFPVSVLRAVNGWDPSLRWMEDTDICTRIAKAFPDRHFYAMPAAQLIHDPKMGLRTFLRRPYMRGLANLQYYRRNNLVPPVFPFPLLWAVLTIIATIIEPVAGLVTAVILPQVLYMWWPARAARERSFWHLTFAYLQLAEEASTIAGLVRGYLILRGEAK